MLWIFLDYSVQSLVFVILPNLLSWIISSCLWQTIFCCNCFSLGLLLLSPALWKIYYRAVFKCFCQVSQKLSPARTKFYINFLASISPHHVETISSYFNHGRARLGASGAFSFLQPQTESSVTASQGLRERFYSPFHCGDISARVLVSFCSSSFLWPSATLPVTSWVFKPQSLA